MNSFISRCAFVRTFYAFFLLNENFDIEINDEFCIYLNRIFTIFIGEKCNHLINEAFQSRIEDFNFLNSINTLSTTNEENYYIFNVCVFYYHFGNRGIVADIIDKAIQNMSMKQIKDFSNILSIDVRCCKFYLAVLFNRQITLNSEVKIYEDDLTKITTFITQTLIPSSNRQYFQQNVKQFMICFKSFMHERK